MATRTFNFSLDGEVPTDVFVDSLKAWHDSLVAAANEAGSPKNATKWTVSNLAKGSVSVESQLETIDEEIATAVDLRVVEFSTALHRGSIANIPRTLQKPARRLMKVVSRYEGFPMTLSTEDTDILVFPGPVREVAEPSGAVVVSTPALESPSLKAYGRIEGKIQTVSSRDSLRFTLYDSVWDRAVTCHLHSEQHDLMENVWDKYAFVEGIVTRDRDSGRPLGIRDIARVEALRAPLRHSGPLPGRGILVNILDGRISPEDYVRRLRDG